MKENNMVRVLQFSTHNEECGIAKYQAQFTENMNNIENFSTEYFSYSPNQTKIMSKEDFQAVLGELQAKMEDFDMLHIQHELSFFKFTELQHIVDLLKNNGKKIIVTVHTAPEAQYHKAKLGGVGPRSLLHFLKSKASNQRFIDRYINPLKKVDLVVVHNEVTKQSLMAFGVSPDNILVIRHPVSSLNVVAKSTDIKENLHVVKGDVVYATVGFISPAKGVMHAVKALNYLPENFKLAILGGVHPNAEDKGFMDEIADYIFNHNLSHRAYITGYVEKDEELNGLIREVDVCVYPYAKQYYDYVSSGSLNLALANGKPVIAYPTRAFLEINADQEVVKFCKSENYYELARSLKELDIDKYTKSALAYADAYAWDKESAKFVELYRTVAQQ